MVTTLLYIVHKIGKVLVNGIDPNTVDRIQKEILRYCKFLKPVYIPLIEPE